MFQICKKKEYLYIIMLAFLSLNIYTDSTAQRLSVSLLDNSRRTFLGTFSAFRTLLVIDVCDVVLYGNSTGFTLFLAELAGQTSGFADLLDGCTAVMAGATHCIGGGFRDELDEVTRTGGDAFAAGLTFTAVDSGNTLIDGDRSKRTGGGTGAKADTAVITGPRGEATAYRRGTVVNADIVTSRGCIFAVTGAFDIGGDFFGLLHLKSEQAADLLCDRITSDRTGIDRSSLIGDGRGESITACVAAAAAVIPRQTFADGDLLFIHLYFKFFIDCDEQNADQQSDDSHCKCGDNDR